MVRAWGAVGLLWFVGCLNYLDRVSITTMRSSLKEEITMTDAQFGLLTTAFLVVYGVLSPLAGFLADRFSRSRTIIVSLFAWSLITWLTGHASNFNHLLVTRALMGVSEACYIPAALALIADYHRGPTRSLATGVTITGIFAGSALGGLGGLLAERYGWRLPFQLFGFVGVVYAALLLVFLRDPPRDAPKVDPELAAEPRVGLLQALTSLLSSGSFLVALLYWGLLGVAGWAVIGWMPTYLKETFNLSQGRAGMAATGFMQTAAAVGVVLGGALADRMSRRHPRGRLLVPMFGLCVAAPAIWFASHSDLLGVALAGLMIYGLTLAFTDANMMPIVCMIADARYRATGYGLLNCFACIVGGITIYVGGWMRDANLNIRSVFHFGAVCTLVCAGLLLLMRPRNAAGAS